MSYAGLAGVLPGLPAGFTDFALPIQEKNGLVWVADPVRDLAATFLGTKTDFSAYLEDSGNIYGRAYVSVMPRANWVAAEVARGNAVAVSPASQSASPALRVLLTADPYGLAWETGRNFGGDYALIAAPTPLVVAAEVEARAKKPRDLPGGASAPTGAAVATAAGGASTLPKWVLPIAVGGGILLLGAIVVSASSKSGYKANAKRYRANASLREYRAALRKVDTANARINRLVDSGASRAEIAAANYAVVVAERKASDLLRQLPLTQRRRIKTEYRRAATGPGGALSHYID